MAEFKKVSGSEISNVDKVKQILADASSLELEKMFADITLEQRNRAGADIALDNAVNELQRKIQTTKHPVNFLSFGVGATGLNLNSSGALRLFRDYSQKYNYYLGSTIHEGEGSGNKESVLAAINQNYAFALRTEKNFVLYYHGHGHSHKTGDWCLPDGELSFHELVDSLTAIRSKTKEDSKIVAYIICDCCYSGHWVDLWKGLHHQVRSSMRVFASCANSVSCYDGVFPKIFFKEARSFTDDQINEMNVDQLNVAIRTRLFPDYFHSANPVHMTHHRPKTYMSTHGAKNTHVAGYPLYDKTELTKKQKAEKIVILKHLMCNEWKCAMESFLSVRPQYCSYEIQFSDCQFYWCCHGDMENWYDQHCTELHSK